MKKLSKKISGLYVAFLLLAITNPYKKASAGKPSNQKENKEITAPDEQEKNIYQWFKTIAEVMSLVKEKSFRKVDFSNILQQALKSSIPYVDPHSAFFPKESYQATLESTSGEFSGIGISVINKMPDDDALIVVDVIEDSPAQKAGIKAGDKIIEANGKKLKNLSTDEAISKIKGKIDTEVKLKIIRNKKPLEFTVKRAIIKDQTAICYHFKKQNIYYLGLKIFAATASKQMADLLEKANQGKCKGIILDLRRNPGGVLEAAIDMSSLFLKKGSLVVTTKDNKGKITASYKTTSDPILKSNIPIFLLIDNFL